MIAVKQPNRAILLAEKSQQHQPRLLRMDIVYCGWTIAGAHAKSGDRATISGYIGKGVGKGKVLLRRPFKTAARD